MAKTSRTHFNWPAMRRRCQARTLTHCHPMPPLLSGSTPTCLPKSSRPSSQLHLHTLPLSFIYGLPLFHSPLSFDSLQQPHVHGTEINQVHNKSEFEVGESSTQSKPTILPMYSKIPITSLPYLSSNSITSYWAPSTNVFPREKLNGQNYFSSLNQSKYFLRVINNSVFWQRRLFIPHPMMLWNVSGEGTQLRNSIQSVKTLLIH